ncbi:hypothetical protein ACVWWR_005267 [Bradyrhizobium sp. LM3.2]
MPGASGWLSLLSASVVQSRQRCAEHGFDPLA